MKKLNKSVFLFISACFFAVLFSVNALAFTGNGKGTESDPFIITKPEQLNEINNNISSYYVLGNDIKVTSSFKSISTFSGSFDGNDYTVSNLNSGLFKILDNGTIQNLQINNANVRGYRDIGVLVEVMQNGNIKDCTVSGVSSGTESIGMMVGKMYKGNIERCVVLGSVSGAFYTGGMVGEVISGTISQSVVEVSIYNSNPTGKENYGIGGIVGSARSINISE